MLYIKTEQTEFLNDLADEIRLFGDFGDIALWEESDECEKAENVVTLTLCEAHGLFLASSQVKIAGKTGRYEIKMPARGQSEIEKKRYRKRACKIAVYRAMRKLFPGEYIPWGSLTGIRPTRLMYELIETDGKEKACDTMLNDFDVLPEKLRLVNEILAHQENVISSIKPSDTDIYIGIPYCRTRCLYCSFASAVRNDKTDMRAYIDALKADIAHGARILRECGRSVRAMYMGGGTPTVLTASELKEVLEFALCEYGGFCKELTVEAGRPDTIDDEKLKVMRELGVNRISVNPQTMNLKTLELVGRTHTPEAVEEVYGKAKAMGFDVNMDIITCLPGEGLSELYNTLESMKRLSPDNLTVHTLAIKRSSRLHEHIDEYEMATPDAAEKMITTAQQFASEMGLFPYYMYRQKYMRGNLENVGYAKPGKVCVYNIDMMEELVSIMAHGAGAMSKCVYGGERRVERIPNPKDIASYIAKVDATASEKRDLFFRL